MELLSSITKNFNSRALSDVQTEFSKVYALVNQIRIAIHGGKTASNTSGIIRLAVGGGQTPQQAAAAPRSPAFANNTTPAAPSAKPREIVNKDLIVK